jgi:hypothetical protein
LIDVLRKLVVAEISVVEMTVGIEARMAAEQVAEAMPAVVGTSWLGCTLVVVGKSRGS